MMFYSQDGDDVSSLDLMVPDTPPVQQDDVTRPRLRVQGRLLANVHAHTHN